MATWGDLVAAEPELAAFVAERLLARPSYLATVRACGAPRVHPVTPVVMRCQGYGDVTLPATRRWAHQEENR